MAKAKKKWALWGQTDTRDSSVMIAAGVFPNQKNYHKNGLNPDLGGTFEDVWYYAPTQPVYLWPLVSSAFRIRAGDANDSAAGTNARGVIIRYLDDTGIEQVETIETNGLSPSLPTVGIGRRILEACVSGVGVKGNSNAGEIIIEHVATGDIVSVIGLGNGHAQQTQHTIEKGFTGFIKGGFVYVLNALGTKEAHVKLWHRPGAYLDAAPFGAQCITLDLPDASGYVPFEFKTPIELSELTDVWAEAEGNATGMEISLHYDIELLRN